MKKHALKYGIALGLICIAFFEISVFLGKVPLGNHKLPELGFHMILVVAAMYAYKQKNNQTLYAWQALSIGYITNLVATVISTFFLWFALKFAHTDLIKPYLIEMLNMLASHKTQHIDTFGNASFINTIAKIKATTLMDIVWDDFLKKTFIMVIPIFIAALILRKKA